jgi:hypothetical protein
MIDICLETADTFAPEMFFQPIQEWMRVPCMGLIPHAAACSELRSFLKIYTVDTPS